MRKLLFPLILACAACTTGAKAPADPPAAPPAPVSKQAPAPADGGTLAQIRSMIGTAACTDAGQCRTLPLGARPCGGPEGYLAWSTAQVSEQDLRALGERYKAERQAQNAKSGMMSDCRFMADPGAVCRAGTCQLSTMGAEAR